MSASGLPPRPGPRHRTTFLRRALTDQATIGAIIPTSATLAARLASLVAPTPGLRVLELGAGTGAISAAIGPRLGAGAVHVALERDPTLLASVGRVAPGAVRIAGDAAELIAHLDSVGITEVDVIVSSLPWSNFEPVFADRVLGAVCSVLAPAGLFATIAYRPTRLNPHSRRFQRRLDSSFTKVVATSTTWTNLPPARLLICRHPRTERQPDRAP